MNRQSENEVSDLAWSNHTLSAFSCNWGWPSIFKAAFNSCQNLPKHFIQLHEYFVKISRHFCRRIVSVCGIGLNLLPVLNLVTISVHSRSCAYPEASSVYLLTTCHRIYRPLIFIASICYLNCTCLQVTFYKRTIILAVLKDPLHILLQPSTLAPSLSWSKSVRMVALKGHRT